MNELQPTLARDVLHVKTALTCVLNDYDEEEDAYIIVLADEREHGHTVTFNASPEIASAFKVGDEYATDIGIEVES